LVATTVYTVGVVGDTETDDAVLDMGAHCSEGPETGLVVAVRVTLPPWQILYEELMLTVGAVLTVIVASAVPEHPEVEVPVTRKILVVAVVGVASTEEPDVDESSAVEPAGEPGARLHE
jgi:hypothetical protein